VGVIQEFTIDLDQLHNDSTTLTLTGDDKAADGGRPGHLLVGFTR
jgi:hypothetical protein